MWQVATEWMAQQAALVCMQKALCSCEQAIKAAFTLHGGDSSAGSGGNLLVQSGCGSCSGSSGSVSLLSADAGSSGNVMIASGCSSGTASSGSVSIASGSSAAGTSGNVAVSAGGGADVRVSAGDTASQCASR